MITPTNRILDELVAAAHQQDNWGEVANYIPELARVSKRQFAISIATPDGQVLSAGDYNVGFSIQSISKIFTLAIALGRTGEQLWKRVGREPSGNAFNSISQLEHEQGRPRNPFVNAGAIVTTDEILAGRSPKEALTEILQFVRAAAEDNDIHYNKAVAASENLHGHRNSALAHFIASFGNLKNPVELTLGTYFHHCAIEMTTEQLARSGRFLLDADGAPRLVSKLQTRRINALMMTCGHYDGSGDFAFRVGLPAKSGVGGGILAVVPKVASIAVWSPGLNIYGNSLQGTEAMAHIAGKFNWSVF